MRLINSILTILFIVLAATHIQVVDAWKWILLFGAMSVLSVMAIFELFFKKALIAMIVGLIVWCLFEFPQTAEITQVLRSDFVKVFASLVVVVIFLFRSFWYDSKTKTE
ncbi:MAG: hypothetical protein KF803_07715 [Cyclobacteriaceae bacterium]|nr:hypothetical protein [Cyclobacteriaceae bacterium]